MLNLSGISCYFVIFLLTFRHYLSAGSDKNGRTITQATERCGADLNVAMLLKCAVACCPSIKRPYIHESGKLLAYLKTAQMGVHYPSLSKSL